MRNRIKKYTFQKGDSMANAREINNLEDLKDVGEMAEGFMIGVSILNKGTIQHYLLTRDFPFVDMLKSWAKVKNLVIENLEKDSQRDF